MPRRRREPETPEQPNLAPFMNMVVILIPMLLLSVIFVSAGVINVSTDLSTTKHSEKIDNEEPLALTIALSHAGFELLAKNERLAPVPGCPDDGPTICLADASVDVAARFERAEQLFDAGKAEQAESALDEAMDAYDFRGLYNELAAIKKDHPEETKVILTGERDMPYAMLIRTMDVARFQLEQDSYTERSQFWAANSQLEPAEARALFSDPVLAVVR